MRGDGESKEEAATTKATPIVEQVSTRILNPPYFLILNSSNSVLRRKVRWHTAQRRRDGAPTGRG